MRIYEGSPRQDYEEVLRSIGAFLDQRGMREILFTEAPDGFIIQGPDVSQAGTYERALRVLGRYIDQQKPRDIFFFEQDGSYVVRLLMGTRAGARHVLAEFTGDEVRTMVEHSAAWRSGRGQVSQRPTRG